MDPINNINNMNIYDDIHNQNYKQMYTQIINNIYDFGKIDLAFINISDFKMYINLIIKSFDNYTIDQQNLDKIYSYIKTLLSNKMDMNKSIFGVNFINMFRHINRKNINNEFGCVLENRYNYYSTIIKSQLNILNTILSLWLYKNVKIPPEMILLISVNLKNIISLQNNYKKHNSLEYYR